MKTSSWPRFRLLCALVISSVCSGGALADEVRPTVIFDLDRTLFNPDQRIAQILRDLGSNLSIPELKDISPEQIQALVGGDRSVLGIKEASTLTFLFGNYVDGSNRSSEFGRLFYFESRYLIHDEVIPGAVAFVRDLEKNLGAKVMYLSGRIKERFEAATWDQLERAGFPGRGEAELILKPEAFAFSNDEFKIGIVRTRLKAARILGIFDDSRRNLQAFAKEIGVEVPLIRVVRQKSKALPASRHIVEIEDFSKDAGLLESAFGLGSGCAELLKPPGE